MDKEDEAYDAAVKALRDALVEEGGDEAWRFFQASLVESGFDAFQALEARLVEDGLIEVPVIPLRQQAELWQQAQETALPAGGEDKLPTRVTLTKMLTQTVGIIDFVRNLRPEDTGQSEVSAYLAQAALELLVTLVAAPAAAPVPGRRRHKVPAFLPQQTGAELLEGGLAILDGRTFEHWRRAVGVLEWIHARPGSPVQTKLAPALSQNWPLTITADELEQHLGEVGGTTAMLLAQVGIGLALQAPHATISLDDLIRAVGLTPHTHAERVEARRWIWGALSMIECLEIHGARKGHYRDPETKQVLNLRSQDRFLMVTGTERPEQATLDGSDVPITVTLAVGPWVERWRDNPQVLSRFGDVLAITGIPGDKLAGAYARGIGPALLQHWRVNAKSAKVTRPGEMNELVVKVRPVKRAWLADFCKPPRPMQTLAEVLAGKNPSRARTYWAGAIAHLKQQRVIAASYQEPKALTARLPRKHWQAAWLAEELDIPPGPKWAADIAEIHEQVQKARRRRVK